MFANDRKPKSDWFKPKEKLLGEVCGLIYRFNITGTQSLCILALFSMLASFAGSIKS